MGNINKRDAGEKQDQHKMHLFVGNLSRNVHVNDLRAEFEKYGPCKINIPQDLFAFVDY